jgi:alkylation response protein AidB-like acyl-CoA dehydrogenase
MSVQAGSLATKGGGWLLETTEASAIFTPDRFTEEHKLIGQTADEFMATEVLPNIDRMEQKDWDFVRSLLRQCGDLGLLGADTPETYGGVHLDKVSSLILSERLALSASFATAYGAQVNLALLAILLFGNDAQKQKYATRLVTAEIIGAYGLSETGAGSDALAAKTRATRQADGSYIISGEKMWISNGGFADLYIVFAKVDGEHFTAFIVERAFGGVSSGKEEHKMGLLGSSTTSVLLQDVRVPAENVLGDVGKGHRVAFNVLNFGRLKLGFMCGGGCVAVIGEAARYAATRQQFGHPIATFGAIKHKLGEMTAKTYALESMLYRTAGLLDTAINERRSSKEDMAAVLAAGEEYAIEASIAKIAGSEGADFVLDENIQIHGGNGFVKDYPAERHFRDARVNRIFEGTNEINRLLIPGLLMRRALKGELPIIQAAKKLQDELMAPPQMGAKSSGGVLADELQTVASMKKVALAVMGVGMLRYAEKLANEQEVMMSIADILIDTYQAESAALRAIDAAARALPKASLQQDAAQVFVHDAAARVEFNAKQALSALAEGDMLRTHLAALRRLLKPAAVNTIALRRRLAEATVAKGGYVFR